jgi:hypothetical protein
VEAEEASVTVTVMVEEAVVAVDSEVVDTDWMKLKGE